MNTTYMTVKVREHGVKVIDIDGYKLQSAFMELQKHMLKMRKHPHATMTIHIWQGSGDQHVKLLYFEDKPLLQALEELQDVMRKIR